MARALDRGLPRTRCVRADDAASATATTPPITVSRAAPPRSSTIAML